MLLQGGPIISTFKDIQEHSFSFFLFRFYLFEKESENIRMSKSWGRRKSERERTASLPAEQGARYRAQSQDPEIMT